MKVVAQDLSTSLATAVAAMCAAVLVTRVHAVQAGINVWTGQGPAGAFVRALAIDPTTPGTLYAGTGRYFGDGSGTGGLYKGTDGGGTWSAANTDPLGPVSALAIDPTTSRTPYAGTSRPDCTNALVPPRAERESILPPPTLCVVRICPYRQLRRSSPLTRTNTSNSSRGASEGRQSFI
jgi:hypothetical protein